MALTNKVAKYATKLSEVPEPSLETLGKASGRKFIEYLEEVAADLTEGATKAEKKEVEKGLKAVASKVEKEPKKERDLTPYIEARKEGRLSQLLDERMKATDAIEKEESGLVGLERLPGMGKAAEEAAAAPKIDTKALDQALEAEYVAPTSAEFDQVVKGPKEKKPLLAESLKFKEEKPAIEPEYLPPPGPVSTTPPNMRGLKDVIDSDAAAARLPDHSPIEAAPVSREQSLVPIDFDVADATRSTKEAMDAGGRDDSLLELLNVKADKPTPTSRLERRKGAIDAFEQLRARDADAANEAFDVVRGSDKAGAPDAESLQMSPDSLKAADSLMQRVTDNQKQVQELAKNPDLAEQEAKAISQATSRRQQEVSRRDSKVLAGAAATVAAAGAGVKEIKSREEREKLVRYLMEKSGRSRPVVLEYLKKRGE